MDGRSFAGLCRLLGRVIRRSSLQDFQSYHRDMLIRLGHSNDSAAANEGQGKEKQNRASGTFRKLVQRYVFVIAAEAGRRDILEYLLQPESMKSEERSKLTINAGLVAALKHRHSETAIYLLDTLQPDLNDFGEQRSPRFTPLIIAARTSNIEMSKILLQRGADPNYSDDNLQTPLHNAAQVGCLEIVKFLVEKYKPQVDATDRKKYTPLHYACRGSHLNVADYLLRHGASAAARTEWGETPLRLAYKRGTLPLVELLMKNPKSDPWQAETTLLQPLVELAIQENRLDMLQILFDDAAPHGKLNSKGESLLHVAASYYRLDILRWLLQQGMNSNHRDATGKTPLHHVCICPREAHQPHHHVQTLQCLVQAGADVSLTDDNHMVPLFYAAHGYTDLLEALLNLGVSVNARDPLGRSALHFASRANNRANVELLLSYQADIDAVDNEQVTCAMYAVEAWAQETFHVLLSHGCDLSKVDVHNRNVLHRMCRQRLDIETYINSEVQIADEVLNQVDSDGWTPLHVAAFCEEDASLEWLLKRGAQIDRTTYDGQTSLHLACLEPSMKNDSQHLVSYGDEASEEEASESSSDSDDGDWETRSNFDSANSSGKDFNGHCPRNRAVRLLINRGLDPTILENNGNPAFFLSAESDCMVTETFEMLRAAASRGFFNPIYQPRPKRPRLL